MAERLDQRLVALGLARSRTKARSLIESGLVTINGTKATRAAQTVAADAAIAVADDPCPYVSRAALKLLHAIERFGLDPTGATALDLGASTGGFVEILLQRGAARVYAVDVGQGQLDPALAAQPSVISLEGTNAKSIGRDVIPHTPDWITSDLSFIGLEKALPPALALADPGATLVALVKPQFEVGPEGIGKGGLVRDPILREEAVLRIETWLERIAWRVKGRCESPIRGGDGNIEYLIWATKC